MQQRKMPFSYEAEQSILGSVFIDPTCIIDLADTIESKDFYKKEHQILFDAILELHSNGVVIDYVTLTNTLNQKGLLPEVGGVDYIVALSASMASSAQLESYVDIVKESATRRQIIEMGSQIAQQGLGGELGTIDLLDKMTVQLSEVSNRRKTEEMRLISDVVDAVVDRIENNISSGADVIGLTTGYSNMDKITFGLQPEHLMILAARPAVGKTAFALNLAINAAKLNKKAVAIFSMEMSAEDLLGRVISRESGIPSDKLKKGPMTNTDWAKLTAAGNILKNLDVFIDDGTDSNVSSVRAKCRKLAQTQDLGFIVIDYLQLLKAPQFGKDRTQEISFISRSLKEMARELKVPVLALAQLSRGVEQREDKRPKLSDLRESGSIEQDADAVMFLYREDYHDRETDRPNIVECSFAKNRHGETGVIEFKFQKECSQFNAIAPTPRSEGQDRDLPVHGGGDY